MKVPVISSLLLMLGIATPLLGIERPKALDDRIPEEAAANRAVEVPEVQEDIKQADPSAWLGVFSQEADEALSAQLGIDGGVVLRFVAEDSPAAAAGLKMHDVVSAVDGEKLTTQDELRAAVLDHKPGDELKLDVVSGGVKKEVSVKLGERPAEMAQLPGALPPGRDGDERFPDLRRQMRELRLGGAGGQFEKEMEGQLKRMEEQLRKMEQQPGFRGFPGMDWEELLKDLPKGGNGLNLNLKSSGSVKLFDEHGSVEMEMADGGKEVKVRDKAGELLYEGPWDTPQDKAAVAPEIRERVERLNFNGDGGGLQLHFHHGALPLQEEAAPEAAPEPEKAAE
jgi:serine protease Do